MRFLANESIVGAAVAALDAAGHDIAWVRLAAPGMSDDAVLAWAARERRILLTFDKDFGELARTVPLASGCGVVLLRISMPKSADVGRRLAEIIGSRDDWAGHFSVIEPGRVRMRRLASPPRS
jgi:predicted nuclease of predicted toxin-antitoxin system